MINVKVVSSFRDHTGYGTASRHFLMALKTIKGISIGTQIISFTEQKVDNEATRYAIKKSNTVKKHWDYNIILLTPEHFPIYSIPDHTTKNIGYFFWEVEGVDPKWIWWCNKMDEIWLPSPKFAQMFEDAGVTVPVKVMPCAIETKVDLKKKFKLPNEYKDKLKFYSIFQWTERKNPRALLETYWKTFKDNKNVVLFLKTYRGDFSVGEREAIKQDIKSWKTKFDGELPEVDLILDEMSEDDMSKLHNTMDIFVSSHRGEGWGYPQAEALKHGNSVISTGFGGIHEFEPNYLLNISYGMVPVFGMGHIPWYHKNQKWAEINCKELSRYMLEFFNKGICKHIPQFSNFNYLEVGKIIWKTLKNE